MIYLLIYFVINLITAICLRKMYENEETPLFERYISYAVMMLLGTVILAWFCIHYVYYYFLFSKAKKRVKPKNNLYDDLFE
jgi:hypothetical protein